MGQCEVCQRVKRRKRNGRASIIKHHLNYKPSITMEVCLSCHRSIHNVERGEAPGRNLNVDRYKIIKELLLSRAGIKQADMLEHKSTSPMIGIRIDVSVYTILEEMAKKKGITVSAFIKGKVEEYARLAREAVPVKEEFVVIGGQRFRKYSGT